MKGSPHPIIFLIEDNRLNEQQLAILDALYSNFKSEIENRESITALQSYALRIKNSAEEFLKDVPLDSKVPLGNIPK